jgi:flagellar M-ring protein FliF
MDFLNKAYAQAADLFRSMTPGARITAALLAAVVVISLTFLFTHPIGGPASDLMHGVPLSADQLPAMEAAFDKANLKGCYKVEGTRILVSQGQESAFMGALADAKALPPNIDTALRRAISESSPFESPKEFEQRVKNGTQETLSLIISAMKGIQRAHVLYDTDITPGLNRKKIVTASVFITPTGSEVLDGDRIAAIKQSVATSIAGMKPENVTVVDQKSGRSWYGNPDSGGSAEDNLYLKLKQNYETDLKAKVLGALTYIPSVSVETSIVLDPKKISKSREVKNDPKPLPIRETEENSSRTQSGGSSATAGTAGLRGQQANVPLALTGGGGSGPREEEKESKRETVSISGGQETESETVGLTPKLAKVSVGVPVSYLKKVWQDNNPEKGKESKGPDAAALDQIRKEVFAKIKKVIAPLLPPAENIADPTELVAVEDFQDPTFEPTPEPGIAKNLLTWLGNSWSLLGMIGLAGMSLLMLRSLIKAAPASLPPLAMPQGMSMEAAPRNAAVPRENMPSPVAAARLRRFSSGPSLRDELSGVVKEDPDTAANILRNWIGQMG